MRFGTMNRRLTRRPADPPSASRTNPSTRDEEEVSAADLRLAGLPASGTPVPGEGVFVAIATAGKAVIFGDRLGV